MPGRTVLRVDVAAAWHKNIHFPLSYFASAVFNRNLSSPHCLTTCKSASSSQASSILYPSTAPSGTFHNVWDPHEIWRSSSWPWFYNKRLVKCLFFFFFYFHLLHWIVQFWLSYLSLHLSKISLLIFLQMTTAMLSSETLTSLWLLSRKKKCVCLSVLLRSICNLSENTWKGNTKGILESEQPIKIKAH